MKSLATIVYGSLLALSASIAAADVSGFATAKRTLDQGAYAKTPEAMIEARAEFERLSKAQPKSAHLHYWVALADWRIAPRILETKKAEAQRYVKDGLKRIDQALKLDPKMADAVALKASLLGLGLQLEPGAMMTLGPEIEMTMQRARHLAANNPRVVLLDAMGTLHKPAFVGGGADRALEKFMRAQELFEAEKSRAGFPHGLEPDWGRFESYAWAGRSAAKLGDAAAARNFYDKALVVEPNNGWVRHVLLPELDRADSTATAGKDGK